MYRKCCRCPQPGSGSRPILGRTQDAAGKYAASRQHVTSTTAAQGYCQTGLIKKDACKTMHLLESDHANRGSCAAVLHELLTHRSQVIQDRCTVLGRRAQGQPRVSYMASTGRLGREVWKASHSQAQCFQSATTGGSMYPMIRYLGLG